MKALTIHQPFAGLIAAGLKTCENRTWATSYRGPLAIHAGLSTKWGSAEDWAELGITDPHVMLAGSNRRGGIVAVCDLVQCLERWEVYADTRRFAMSPAQERYIEGPWCWILANPRKVWVPCKGQQGLWTPSAEVLTAIAKGTTV